MAIFNALITKSWFNRFSIAHPTIFREYISIIAAKLSHPSLVRIYVISDTHDWFGIKAVKFRCRWLAVTERFLLQLYLSSPVSCGCVGFHISLCPHDRYLVFSSLKHNQTFYWFLPLFVHLMRLLWYLISVSSKSGERHMSFSVSQIPFTS